MQFRDVDGQIKLNRLLKESINIQLNFQKEQNFNFCNFILDKCIVILNTYICML